MHITSTPEPEQYVTSSPEPEPGSYTTPEPEPELHITSTPEPEQYVTSNPEPEPGSYVTPEPEPGSYTTPEPEPELHMTSKLELGHNATSNPIPEWYSTPEPKRYTIPEPEPKQLATVTPEIKWYTSHNSSRIYPEPGPYSIAKPEPYPKPEPRSKPEPQTEPEYRSAKWGEVSPEPGPEFEYARKEWGVAWPIHYFIFAIIFTMLAFFTLNSIVALINNRRKKTFQRHRFFLAINIMLFYLCVVMALSLFIDPYSSGEFIKEINFRGIIYLLITLKYPCLTASFSLVQISLLEILKFTLYSTRLHSLRLIFCIIGIHFSVVLIGGLVMLSIVNATAVVTSSCEILMLSLGVTFSIMSIYSGLKICLHHGESEKALKGFKNVICAGVSNITVSQFVTPVQPTPGEVTPNLSAGKSFEELKYENNNSCNETNTQYTSTESLTKDLCETKKSGLSKLFNIIRNTRNGNMDKSVGRIAILMVITAMFAIMLCGCIIYHMNAYASRKFDAWKWYIYQTFSRTSESGMVACMAYIVRRKNTFKISNRKNILHMKCFNKTLKSGK